MRLNRIEAGFEWVIKVFMVNFRLQALGRFVLRDLGLDYQAMNEILTSSGVRRQHLC